MSIISPRDHSSRMELDDPSPPFSWILSKLAEGIHPIAVRELCDAYYEERMNELQTRKRKRRHGPLPLAPPTAWIASQVAGGLPENEVQKKWNGMTQHQRQYRRKYAERKAKIQEIAQAKVDAGSTDSRTLTVARQGGYARLKTPEFVAFARAAARARDSERTSSAWLTFRRNTAKGCTVKGCVLAPADSDPLLCLLEHDHVDPDQKTSDLARLHGEERLAEAEKTQVKCLWHHFIHTREHRGDKPIPQKKKGWSPILALVKVRTGCEHPLHASMPYASLVPSYKDDPLLAGFMEVSHIDCRESLDSSVRNGARNVALLEHLASEKAVVHCSFCHRLYTMCEHASMSNTSGCQYQYAVLLRRFPAFVQHFDEVTSAVDWEEERRQRSSNMSEAQQKSKKSRSTEGV